MLALFCGLALAAETLTPAHPDAAVSATEAPAEPAKDQKFLSTAVETTGSSEVEVETPALAKKQEEMRKREVMQIAEEVEKTLEGDDARSGSTGKNEEIKHENLASAEAATSETAAGATESKREVAQIEEEVKQAAGKQSSDEAAANQAAGKQSSDEAAANQVTAKQGSEEAVAKQSSEKKASAEELVADPKAAQDMSPKVLQAELAETALVATRASSSMHFATLLACLVSIALIGHLRRLRTNVNQPPLLG
jgi:hypothetical protein